jgi:membrane-bound lytic murein transglycosylase D
MKQLCILGLLLLTTFVARAQNDVMTLDDLVQSAQDWAQTNLDENVLRALQSADQDKVNQFFQELEKLFHGEYVINLGKLKDTARTLAPLLDNYEETRPYAAWLKSRLDYLDVADEFRLIIPAPKTEPGQPPKPPPNPPPQKEREIWIKKLADRPWPTAAKPYVSRLKAVFTKEKVPPELVWVAEVESSFDPRARSPVGAAGMFQLMPATAKRFGLRRWPFDERLKPEESARAAAQYLHQLHGQFKDWRLALAAYNAGEGTVQGLLRRQKTPSFDAISGHLPAETQMYVPRVEATILRREGIRLSQIGG